MYRVIFLSVSTMFGVIKEDMAVLEAKMRCVVSSPVDLVTKISTHLVEAGGKRIRPALCFLTAHCGSFDRARVMPLAVAIEIIHMSTLVHDDVIDEAATRRGVATANAKWGNQTAVLSGDYLFAKAFSLVIEAGYSHKVLKILSDVICDLSEGEIIQNKETYCVPRDIDGYRARIAKKTANFLAASCQTGGMICDMEESFVQAMREYGYCIGMAFQITDDILDITASSKQIGKPAGNDIRQGIVTLPVMRALDESPESGELEAILRNPAMADADVERALAIVRATDAVEYAYGEAKSYLERAVAALPEMPSELRQAYKAVATFIGERNF